MIFEERPVGIVIPDTIDGLPVHMTVTGKSPKGQFAKDRVEFSIKTEGSSPTIFEMTADSAIFFAEDIIKQARLAISAKNMLTDNVITFKNAQMSCCLGLIGKLRITKLSNVKEKDEIGFAYYKLEYFGDVEVDDTMYEVDNVKLFFPLTEEAQFDYMRSLVGGNHQYTSQIAIDLVNFSLEEINAEMINKIAESFRQK